MSSFVRDFRGSGGRPILMQVKSSDNQLLPVQWGVPNGRIWCVHGIHLRLVTSATVGNRLLRLEYEDLDDQNSHRRTVGTVQSEGENRSYHWGPDLPLETFFVQDQGELFTQMPLFWMAVDRDGVDGGGSRRSNMTILDENSIDPASPGDSITGLTVEIIEFKDDPNERSVIPLEPNI